MLRHSAWSLLIAGLLAIHPQAWAEGFGNIRMGGEIGFGQAGAESEGTIRVEGPLAFSAFIDYSLDPRFTFGAEHERSLAGSISSVGVTDISMKWYFWTPQPQRLVSPDDKIEQSFLMQKNFVPFFGTALGFAQASFPAKGTETDVLVVGPYVALKAGVEYPLTQNWGGRSEFVYGMTVGGTGSAEIIHLLIGIYYFL